MGPVGGEKTETGTHSSVAITQWKIKPTENMINIAQTKANNPSVRIGSMILRTVQESCLYIDAWCAPGIHIGMRAHMVKLDDSKATSEKHLKMRWFHIYTSNTSITSNWGDFFANMFESYLHWHYHLHTPYLPQCPKVGHFWYRCPKCPKWGTKWGAKWGH